MSSEILRRAASLIRERAEAAKAGTPGGMGIAIKWSGLRSLAGRGLNESEAEHLATWSDPAVALAVADLLDLAATHEKRTGDEAGQGYTGSSYGYVDPSCSQCGTPDEYAEPWPCAYVTRGLAVARQYLGEAS